MADKYNSKIIDDASFNKEVDYLPYNSYQKVKSNVYQPLYILDQPFPNATVYDELYGRVLTSPSHSPSASPSKSQSPSSSPSPSTFLYNAYEPNAVVTSTSDLYNFKPQGAMLNPVFPYSLNIARGVFFPYEVELSAIRNILVSFYSYDTDWNLYPNITADSINIDICANQPDDHTGLGVPGVVLNRKTVRLSDLEIYSHDVYNTYIFDVEYEETFIFDAYTQYHLNFSLTRDGLTVATIKVNQHAVIRNEEDVADTLDGNSADEIEQKWYKSEYSQVTTTQTPPNYHEGIWCNHFGTWGSYWYFTMEAISRFEIP